MTPWVLFLLVLQGRAEVWMDAHLDSVFVQCLALWSGAFLPAVRTNCCKAMTVQTISHRQKMPFSSQKPHMQILAQRVNAFQWDLSLLGEGELKMTGSMDIYLKNENYSNLMSPVKIVPQT